jgi:hypothetical protein
MHLLLLGFAGGTVFGYFMTKNWEAIVKATTSIADEKEEEK